MFELYEWALIRAGEVIGRPRRNMIIGTALGTTGMILLSLGIDWWYPGPLWGFDWRGIVAAMLTILFLWDRLLVGQVFAKFGRPATAPVLPFRWRVAAAMINTAWWLIFMTNPYEGVGYTLSAAVFVWLIIEGVWYARPSEKDRLHRRLNC